MLILITYDVSTIDKEGRYRLRKVAKVCEDFGMRVQNSVFECHLDSMEYRELKATIERIIDKEKDSVRYYNLGSKYKNKTIHMGTKVVPDINDVVLL